MHPFRARIFIAVLVEMALAPRTLWANPQSVQEGEPVEIEQAFATAVGKLTFENSAEYSSSNSSGEKQLWEVSPEIEYGLMNGVQVSISPDYDAVTLDHPYGGAVEGHLLYQFNDQGEILPAFAMDASYASP